jgi:hypothetical protein
MRRLLSGDDPRPTQFGHGCGLGLLEDDAKRPGRFWLVLTSGDPRDREEIVDSVDGWQTIDRHEFENSTVFLLSRKEP